MFRIGGVRVGRHFSASIFLICVLEMIIYINICMTEEAMNSERHTTESYLQRDKNNLVLWAAPTPTSRAEERHKQQMEEAQEALKRAALTNEIEREQLLLEKNSEQQELETEVQQPFQQRNHFSESSEEANEGDANGHSLLTSFRNKVRNKQYQVPSLARTLPFVCVCFISEPSFLPLTVLMTPTLMFWCLKPLL